MVSMLCYDMRYDVWVLSQWKTANRRPTSYLMPIVENQEHAKNVLMPIERCRTL